MNDPVSKPVRMDLPNVVDKPNRDPSFLAPFFYERVLKLLARCKDQGLNMDIFEGYRSPERQEWLYASSRTREGKWLTDAKPFRSWHQYCLGADIVFKNPSWTWEEPRKGDWDLFRKIAVEMGFETLKKEYPHIQISSGLSTTEARKIQQTQGLIGLWSVVEQRLKLR